MPKPKKITHPDTGKEYEIRYMKRLKRLLVKGKMVAVDGYCDHPKTKNPKIVVRKDMEQERELEVIIHELIHFGNYKLSEETVQALGEIISQELWDNGWRKIA